jgi:hypothetical protein
MRKTIRTLPHHPQSERARGEAPVGASECEPPAGAARRTPPQSAQRNTENREERGRAEMVVRPMAAAVSERLHVEQRKVVAVFAGNGDFWARGGIKNAVGVGITRARAVAGSCRFCRNRNHMRQRARVAGDTTVGVWELRWEGGQRSGSRRMEVSGWAAGTGTTRSTARLERVYYIEWASTRGMGESWE